MEFSWKPDLGAKRSVEPDVTVTKFNGYEARTPNSINSKMKKWSCTFTRNLAEAEMIDNFLEEAGGVTAFLWTDPKGYKSTFVCRSWEMNQIGFGVFAITATFEEVFEVK